MLVEDVLGSLLFWKLRTPFFCFLYLLVRTTISFDNLEMILLAPIWPHLSGEITEKRSLKIRATCYLVPLMRFSL